MTTPSPFPEGPSLSSLRRASLVAVVIAVVLAVTAVLPAEYGVDPTGVGSRIGLTQMGRLKQELAKEAIEDARADSVAAAAASAK
ncbi:MAG: hypothetical protein K2Y26_08640 [Gemmatimonadaceae bacterium]|jgi:hypothetical protein|uniref:hypothetical protein n=1 Tax=Gemmatimonas sp. UBA7669 TaxID=1946568 RepID=UPI0025BFDA59|nr:hypothetical protein [Gemmatimonas sp. UBA7669]MBX9855581.1 hypothetical protein [Gemmatimonadaceae bacterium]